MAYERPYGPYGGAFDRIRGGGGPTRSSGKGQLCGQAHEYNSKAACGVRTRRVGRYPLQATADFESRMRAARGDIFSARRTPAS